MISRLRLYFAKEVDICKMHSFFFHLHISDGLYASITKYMCWCVVSEKWWLYNRNFGMLNVLHIDFISSGNTL